MLAARRPEPAGAEQPRAPAGTRSGFPGLQDPAMMLELIGAMLDAGAGLGQSLELIAALMPPDLGRQLRPVVSALAIGADWDTAWRSSGAQAPQLLALRDALAFAALTGAPSSALLHAQAARLRRERNRAAEQRAAALGVKLVVPLGCALPPLSAWASCPCSWGCSRPDAGGSADRRGPKVSSSWRGILRGGTVGV